MYLTSDTSSPISTPQTSTVCIKPLISTPPASSQPKASTPVVKQGPVSQSATQQPVTAARQQVVNLSLLFSAQIARQVLHLVQITRLVQFYCRTPLPNLRVH
uniref:Uncharacterized protein n=1 Tax=Capra hircus TaxID=9925 RepID=A0A452E2X3_CAPHI